MNDLTGKVFNRLTVLCENGRTKDRQNNGYDENAPYGECTIDRINPFGDYAPNNCRWVNMMVQSHNKRARMDGDTK